MTYLFSSNHSYIFSFSRFNKSEMFGDIKKLRHPDAGSINSNRFTGSSTILCKNRYQKGTFWKCDICVNFDGGVEAVKLILKFQMSSIYDSTNLYNVCEELV